jgi:prepilin-type N-terminal cleavage/methylation domain-containing protein
MTYKQRSSGFSLIEIMVAIVLLGVLASILLPTLKTDISTEKNRGITLDAVAELAQAYVKYQKDALPDATTSADDLVQEMNFIRIINDSSYNVQVAEATSPLPCTTLAPCALWVSPCDAATPCVLLQNGALIQYDVDLTFAGTGYNSNALHFVVDPDADGDETATSLVMFFSGRMTTVRYAPMAVFDAADGLPVGPVDPEYIWRWTDG